MAETMRCPHCGASNPTSAQWCGLCLERFVVAEDQGDLVEAPAEAPEEAAAEPPPADAIVEPHGDNGTKTATALRPSPSAEGTAFVVSEEGIEWTCRVCDHANPLEAQSCVVCGTSFAEAMKPPVERPQRDAGTAALISLFMPGAGHAYLGLWPQAITRAVVSLWVAIVVIAGIVQGEVPGSTLLAVTFGLIAVMLWAAAAHDAYREARGELTQVLLKGRVFLYLVLVLLALLFFMLLGAGVSARS